MSLPVLVWALLCLIWGTTWIFIKLGLRDLPPLQFAGIRFVIATSVLVALISVRRIRLPRDRADWRLIFVTGILAFGMNYGLLFWGEQYTSSGLAAVLQAIIPVFGLLLAHHYLPDERMTIRKLSGVMLGVVGVGVIFSDQMAVEGPMALWGSVAIVVGALAVAWSNVLVKARARHLDPAVLAAGQMVFGLVPLLGLGLVFEGNPLEHAWTPMAIGALLYLALVGSVVAFLLFYWLVRQMDVTKVMLIALVTPVIAVGVGMVFLDEQFNWRLAVGTTAILAGIGMVLVKRRAPRPVVP